MSSGRAARRTRIPANRSRSRRTRSHRGASNFGSNRADVSQPLVSCIIIFLNEENFLAEAIESVLGQTYPNWELLLVDDGSTDGSASIARAYCSKDPQRIRYLTHEDAANRGMSASRNLGIREAHGPLVAMLDADDTWMPEKLEQQVEMFRRSPEAAMVCGATRYWHSWNKDSDRDDVFVRVGDKVPDGRSRGSLESDQLHRPVDLLRRLYPLGSGVGPTPSSVMFMREAALDVGGFEESFPGLFEDQAFLTKMYLAVPTFVSKTCVSSYRQHSGSCCAVTKASGTSREIERQFLEWLEGYLDAVGNHDPLVRVKLRARLLRCKFPGLARLIARAGRAVNRFAPGRGSRRQQRELQ
jgi:glycosyltransferase involved in cell wall biosynthesis